MSIKREDLDAGRVDFANVTSGKRLAPIYPGEIVRIDFLEPMKISIYTLAQVIKVPRSRVNDIVLGRRAITTDTALRLARYFGTSPDRPAISKSSQNDLTHVKRPTSAAFTISLFRPGSASWFDR